MTRQDLAHRSQRSFRTRGHAIKATFLSRYTDALRHRDYRLLVLAFLVDSIGGWAASVVLAVVVFDRTHSLPLLAAVGAAKWIPGLLVAPLGGVVADRYDRRSVMALAATVSGLVAVAQTVVVAAAAPIALLLLLQVAAAVANAPYRPAAGRSRRRSSGRSRSRPPTACSRPWRTSSS